MLNATDASMPARKRLDPTNGANPFLRSAIAATSPAAAISGNR